MWKTQLCSDEIQDNKDIEDNCNCKAVTRTYNRSKNYQVKLVKIMWRMKLCSDEIQDHKDMEVSHYCEATTGTYITQMSFIFWLYILMPVKNVLPELKKYLYINKFKRESAC